MTLPIILILVAAFGKGMMDKLMFHFYEIEVPFIKNNPKFWNPEVSWENKYHVFRKPNMYDSWVTKVLLSFGRWLFMNPLVFLTDAWHLFQFIFLNAIFSTIALLSPHDFVISFLVSRLAFGIVFGITYNIPLMKQALKILLNPFVLAFLVGGLAIGVLYFTVPHPWPVIGLAAIPLTIFVLWLIKKLWKKS